MAASSIALAYGAMVACKEAPKATPTANATATRTPTANASATGISVPAASYSGAALVTDAAAPATPATGMLTQCHPVAAVRARADGPDLDAHGCPMKLRSDSEFTYSLNAAAMAKQKKGAGLCCYDEHAVR